MLIHIGMHKTGSSWLQQRLFAAHSDFHALVGEGKHSENAIVRYLVTTPEEDYDPSKCLALVKDAGVAGEKIPVLSAERLSGHPLSGGFDAAAIARKIYGTFPNAKILIVERDPVDMVQSVYKQLVKEGATFSVQEFLDYDAWKAPGPSPAIYRRGRIAALYAQHYSSRQVLVLSFEDFVTKKHGFLERLADFTGANLEEALDISTAAQNPVNNSFSNRKYRAVRILNRIRKSEANPSGIFKYSVATSLRIGEVFQYLFSNTALISNKELKHLEKKLDC